MCVVSFLHLLQYMVAVPLIFGNLEPQMYNDDFAADPRIDELRAKTWCEEDPRYTTEYMEPEKRSIGNHVVVEFNDGSKIEYGLDYVSLARRGGMSSQSNGKLILLFRQQSPSATPVAARRPFRSSRPSSRSTSTRTLTTTRRSSSSTSRWTTLLSQRCRSTTSLTSGSRPKKLAQISRRTYL